MSSTGAQGSLWSVRVAALQFDVRVDDPAANLAAVGEGLRRASEEECRLVVLPEMWPTSFVPAIDERARRATEEALERLAAWSGEYGLVVCGSAYGFHPGRRPTNRFHIYDRGRHAGGYDKLHLFTPAAEPLSFSEGEDPLPAVPTSVGVLAPVVCYDLRFPAPLRAAFHAGAQLCVCCAQWPLPRASHWEALVRGRAVEGLWPVVAANRTGRSIVGRRRLELDFPGNSLVVSPDGVILAEGQGEAGLVAAEIDLEAAAALRRRVPVGRDERPWGDGGPSESRG